ncbi:UDP-3-O-acyl-N-acetylglucosamine deacetylase [Kaarinaea lacus]
MTSINDKGSTTQRTLKQPITYVGIGLHTGKKVSMIVRPASDGQGIHFHRKDVPAGTGFIPARWYNIVETRMSTVLGNEHGVTISTVEHLLAALRGCGVDNAFIEVDGPEVPIMDGSAGPFVSLIERIGTVCQDLTRHAIWIHQPIEVRTKDKFAIMMPSDVQRITVSIDFNSPVVGSQSLSVELVNEAFVKSVARARTFGFTHELETLQRAGLIQGGSLNNAILVDGERIVNEEGLRFKDEFVRHKVLDCYGDLSLAGAPILGHYYTHKPGHELNALFLQKLFDSYSAWSYISIDEYHHLMGHSSQSENLEQTELTESTKANSQSL